MTISGLIDILSIVFAAKNTLEKELLLDEICEVVKTLKERLRRYCEKASVAGEALAQNRVAARGDSFLEKCCDEYSSEKGKDLCLKYSMVGDSKEEHWVPVEDLGSPQDIKLLFRTLKDREASDENEQVFFFWWLKKKLFGPRKVFFSKPHFPWLVRIKQCHHCLFSQEFAEQCVEKLTSRFGESHLLLAYTMFRPDWAFTQAPLPQKTKNIFLEPVREPHDL